MAERRMFAKTIVLSDAFLDMPMSARCLYFTLGMLADDDGFVNAPRSIMRQCGASDDDMKLLIAKKFVLVFESGVIVIKHWRINNYLQNDRITPTKYTDEKAQLEVTSNRSYRVKDDVYTDNVYTDKNRLDKESIDKINNLVVVSAHESEETPEAENDLGRVMSYYMDKINPTPSPICLDLLKGYTESLGADVILHAFGIALDERKTGWSYIQGILQHYERDGLKTMDAVLRAEQEHQAGKEEAKDRGRKEKPSHITGKAKIDWKPDELGKLVTDLDRI